MSYGLMRPPYLVLEIYWGVEVWNFGIDGFADDLSFAGVEEGAHF